MKRLYVNPAQLGAIIRLGGAQARYLTAVLRLVPGDSIELFDGLGSRWPAEVIATAATVVELRVGQKLPDEPHGAADVWLAQALAKADKLDFVVQKATELGARRIVPLFTERAVVKLDAERGAARAERWRRIAQEAARQCGRADVPRVDAPRTWDELFPLLHEEPDRHGILLDPGAEKRLSAAARGTARILLAVGPEGGFSPEERERAQRQGFAAAALGPRVLRTETVALAALAVLMHVQGELG